MKNLILPALCTALLSSCYMSQQAHRSMGRAPVPAQPYVQLWNKEKTVADTLKDILDSLVTPAHTFAKKDVSFYNDGKTTFANICTPCQNPYMYKFAPRIIEGNLNIYQAHWPTKDKYGRIRQNTQNLIEKNGAGQLLVYRYHNLKRMILPGEPGYEYIHRYAHRRWRQPLGILGGLAIEFTGIGITGNIHNQSSDLILAAGDVLIAAGICGVLYSAIFLYENQDTYMSHAVARYNGME